ncbi:MULTISPECIES: DUF6114 domain-containing protein [unclassified Streptomyces]|uniref:DUF6114 domain-containing protein n=1 Tax=unclassified Streptomyces TaxID=2593676 RepID=UPI0006FADE57|nr:MULTISPECIES: DUF6114 domain-containing protein [unclassified Streptomyces]KQX57486.1 hypothetical protein ASD33_27760 [Streptomyces sp. Root1304]KRA98858.1 hypothetical protein ASE09_24570 [Streptomyces sp. Root66D1]
MTTDPPPEPTPEPAPGAAPAASSEPTDPAAPVAGPPGRPRGARAAFRQWRRTRPFWAAVWTGLGGFVIFFLPMAPLGKILQVGVGGIAGMAGGVVLMAMALLVLLMPSQRHTAGVIAVIAGVASFPLSNLGGLFVGMILSVLGGSMAFAWLPEKPGKRRGGLLRRTRPATGTAAPAASLGSGTV